MSKERFTEKIMLMERVIELQQTAFLGLESCSTITNIGTANSESDEEEITIDGLDLAVSKERLTEKIMLMERVIEIRPTAVLGLESCSTITSIETASSESDEFLAMIKSSSEESVDINQWEIRDDDIMITEVVELSSEGDVYQLVNYCIL